MKRNSKKQPSLNDLINEQIRMAADALEQAKRMSEIIKKITEAQELKASPHQRKHNPCLISERVRAICEYINTPYPEQVTADFQKKDYKTMLRKNKGLWKHTQEMPEGFFCTPLN